MQETYDKCPICGNLFDTVNNFGNGISYSCNNEREIIFAKAGKKPVPAYHMFSFTRPYKGWMLQFNLSPKKIIRIVKHNDVDFTNILDRRGSLIMRIDTTLEPDFPSLEKLRNKIKTCINFS